MSAPQSKNIASIRFAAAFAMSYITILSIACYLKFETFQYTDFDLAIHTQSIHNLLRGSFDCSILGVPYPGNHMAVILGVIAPFYALFPSPLTLLIIQTIVIAAGSAAVFIYAQRHIPSPYPAVLAAVYLLYPPLAYMNLYEFHPVAFATTFLLFALLYYDKARPLPYAAFLLLAMACQENISLLVIMMGFRALIDRRRLSWSLYPIAAGALWFSLCVLWIMPKLNPGLIQFNAIYGRMGNSLPEIAVYILRNPVETAIYAFSAPNLLYLAALLIPLAFTPLAAPAVLLPALPLLAQRLLSERGSETTILFHYQAEIIPFLFAAAIHGIARLGRCRRLDLQRIAMVLITGLTILSVDLADVPTQLLTIAARAKQNREFNWLRRKLLNSVGSKTRVVTTFRYLSHLSNRHTLYSLHHIYTGRYTLSKEPYPTPSDLELAVIDRDDPLTFGINGFFTEGGHTNIAHMLELNRMAPVMDAGPLIVFARVQDNADNTSNQSNRQP